MKYPRLEVNLNNKTLKIENRKLQLEDSFFGAEILPLNHCEKVLNLKYLLRDSCEDEGVAIYESLIKLDLDGKIQVSACPESKHPTTSIFGKMSVFIEYL